MSLYIAGILSKEFTCIPKILSTYFGKFYSNALCNGCTWLFIVWYVLHSGLDYALNELFRKMKYKEYNRIRLKHALWYLGFYCTAFFYTGATLFQNRVNVLGFKRIQSPILHSDLNSELVLGFMVLLTFFIHSSFWEIVQYDSRSTCTSFVLLCLILIISFFLRIIEVAFTLIGFISITQVCIESTKLLFVVTRHDSVLMKLVVLSFFGISIASFILSYLIGVPLVFLLPLGRKIIVSQLPVGYILFTFTLGCWYISEINNSPLFKLIGHWLFHTEKSNECCGDLVECSLFPLRNDFAFNILQLRKEIKERHERMLALRKQSRKGMLMQTIKCMVNFKRKIHARRASRENSPEKQEAADSPLWPKEEADDETTKLIEAADDNNESINRAATDGQQNSIESDVLDASEEKIIEDRTDVEKYDETLMPSHEDNVEVDRIDEKPNLVENCIESDEKKAVAEELKKNKMAVEDSMNDRSIEEINFKYFEKTDQMEEQLLNLNDLKYDD